MMFGELFAIVMLVILVVVSLPVFLLEALIIICHILEDKEQNDEYNRFSKQNKDGGGEGSIRVLPP